MLQRLKTLIGGDETASDSAASAAGHSDAELRLAAAALLFEAAMMDGAVDDDEMSAITGLLTDYFDLSDDEAAEVIAAGEEAAQDSAQLYGFTRIIKDRFSPEERIQMIEMLWAVAYTDGRLHHLETNLIRRIAGLIYVPDRESGEARKKARERRKGN